MYNIYLYDHIWYFTTSILEGTTVLGDKMWYNSENLYTASVLSKISFQLYNGGPDATWYESFLMDLQHNIDATYTCNSHM